MTQPTTVIAGAFERCAARPIEAAVVVTGIDGNAG